MKSDVKLKLRYQGAPESGAIFSDCGHYRYELWRRWGEGRAVLFVGLNPSTADAEKDDPTIRRCISFARDWGFDALYMANLFAWRATRPADMMAANAPIGPCNDKVLSILMHVTCDLSIACWGNHGSYLGRASEVLSFSRGKFRYLRLNKGGAPAHLSVIL